MTRPQYAVRSFTTCLFGLYKSPSTVPSMYENDGISAPATSVKRMPMAKIGSSGRFSWRRRLQWQKRRP